MRTSLTFISSWEEDFGVNFSNFFWNFFCSLSTILMNIEFLVKSCSNRISLLYLIRLGDRDPRKNFDTLNMKF